jgi:hypothetical protein
MSMMANKLFYIIEFAWDANVLWTDTMALNNQGKLVPLLTEAGAIAGASLKTTNAWEVSNFYIGLCLNNGDALEWLSSPLVEFPWCQWSQQ